MTDPLSPEETAGLSDGGCCPIHENRPTGCWYAIEATLTDRVRAVATDHARLVEELRDSSISDLRFRIRELNDENARLRVRVELLERLGRRDEAQADSELLAKVEALLRCNEGRLIWYSLTRQTYNVGSHVDAPTLREALRKLVGSES